MKFSQIYDDDMEKELRAQINQKKRSLKFKVSSPFLKINVDKKKYYPNLSKRLENAKMVINSQTDKLLIEGFEGDAEDFQKYYNKVTNLKLKNIANIKKRRKNIFLIRDGYSGPIKLTKTKEFNLAPRQKDKLLSKIKLQNKYNSNTNLKYSKINNIYFNNQNGMNNTTKSHNISSNYSIYQSNIYNKSGNNSKNLNYDKPEYNTINGSYGNTFYFYKNSTDRHNKNNKYLKSRSISLNNFVTLRDILNDTSYNVKDINLKLKRYIQKNDINGISSKSTRNTNKTTRMFNLIKGKDDQLRTTLESLQNIKDKNNEKNLKLIKKDEGVNSQNIWIKRSTANLISFGNSFINLDDNHFYQERNRFMNNYPKVEKEANIDDDHIIIKENGISKEYILKMDKNSRKINELSNLNNRIIKKLKNRINEIKEKN